MADVMDRPAVAAFDDAVAKFGSDRISIYEGLISELEAAANDPRAANFQQVFTHAQTVLGLKDVQLSELLHVSRPSVNRWARGLVVPHPVMARAVFLGLLESAKRDLHDLKVLER